MFSYFYGSTNPFDHRDCHVNSFQPVCFFSSGSDHFNIRKIISQFPNVVRFIRPQVAFVFLARPPFFFNNSDFLIKYPFILVKSLHSCLSMFLPGDAHEDFNGDSSSPLFILFLLRWNQVKLCRSYPFSLFQIPSHAGAILSHSPLAIQLFRSAEDISKIHVSTLHSFKLFRDWYLIQVI